MSQTDNVQTDNVHAALEEWSHSQPQPHPSLVELIRESVEVPEPRAQREEVPETRTRRVEVPQARTRREKEPPSLQREDQEEANPRARFSRD